MKINLLRHAAQRVDERHLDMEEIHRKCTKVAPMLTPGTPLRFRIGNTTIVAKKKGNDIQIITAWKHQVAN